MEFKQFYSIQRILGLVIVASLLIVAVKGLPLSETTETNAGTSNCRSDSQYMATHESRRIVSALNKHERLINRLQRSVNKGKEYIKLSQGMIDYMTKVFETIAKPEPFTKEITNITCPFEYVPNFNQTRIPKNITTVECRGGCTDDPTKDCIPMLHYFTAMNVLDSKMENSKMENSRKKSKRKVSLYTETIKVACICVKRADRKPKEASTITPYFRAS